MKGLIIFGLLIGLQFISTVYSTTTEGGSCENKPGVCIEPVIEPVTLCEGPHWDDETQRLYFVDIPDQKFYCYDPATGSLSSTYIKTGPLAVAVPVAGEKNKFVAGAGTEFIEFTWDPTKNGSEPEIKKITAVDTDRNGNRFNDGKVDPMGRFWGGTMGLKAEPDVGSLYRIDTDLVPKRIVSPVSISNGLAWSHDNTTFYYIDSPTYLIYAYDYDNASGNITNQRVLFDYKKNNVLGQPDGMTIDTAGNLWIACYGGGRVICVDAKTGNLLRTVIMPVDQVTSLAFGGNNRDVLYVTSARQGLTEEGIKSQPQSGSLFAVKGLGVGGQPMHRFKK